MLCAGRALATPEISVERSPRAMGCPDSADLEAAVAKQRAGPTKAGAPERDPGERIEVRIARDDEGYEALIDAPRGLRRIRDPGPSCDGLAAALAVTVALILDEIEREAGEEAGEGFASGDAPAAEPEEAPAPPARVAPRPSAPRDASARLPPSRRETPAGEEGAVSFHLLAGPSLGLLTPLSLAALGEIEIRLGGRLSFGVGLAWLPTRTIAFPAAAYPEGEVDVSLAAGIGRACLRAAGSATASLDLCAMPAAGALRGEGRNYRSSRGASEPWVALGAGAVAAGRLAGSLGWSGRLGVFVPLARPAFTVTSTSGSAYESAPLALLVAAGLRASL